MQNASTPYYTTTTLQKHNPPPETKTKNSILKKLNLIEAMIARADKSNALVILPLHNTTTIYRTSS
jgi:hypothetical protein